jgi:hypothetical protein
MQTNSSFSWLEADGTFDRAATSLRQYAIGLTSSDLYCWKEGSKFRFVLLERGTKVVPARAIQVCDPALHSAKWMTSCHIYSFGLSLDAANASGAGEFSSNNQPLLVGVL